VAKVLQIFVAGLSGNDDETTVHPVLDLKFSETGQPVLEASAYPSITLKVLGVYKTELQLNNNMVQAAKDFLESNYSITGIDATYLSAGFTLASIL